MPQEDSKLLLKGAFILAFAGTITKILSAIYRIPFQNIVGDIGFYIYQQIYPIYGVSVALATYGFPVIISKLIAEREEKHDSISTQQIIQASFIFIGTIGLALFLIIFFGSSIFAKWMGDTNLAPLIRIISFSFLLMPFISSIRGFFQGQGMMFPTAVSQIQEQLIRVVLIIVVAFVFVSKGFSLYDVGGGALAASITGGVAALVVLLIYYLKQHRLELKLPNLSVFQYVSKTLLLQGSAVCISGMLLVLFQLVDSLNIFALLTKSGVDFNTAKELKGVYDRGQPLIQLGTVAATSLSLTLVPLISSDFKKGNYAGLQKKVQIAIKISFIVGLGATVGIMNIMESTNTMLFANEKGSAVLSVFSISIFISSIILTITGILQGMGKAFFPAIYIVMGILIKLGGNQVLIPTMGTMGASISTVSALAIILCLFIYKLIKMEIPLLPMQFYIKLVFSALVMTVILQIWTHLFVFFKLTTRWLSVLEALGGVAIGGIVYIFMIGILQILDKKDAAFIPFGKLLLRLTNKQGDKI